MALQPGGPAPYTTAQAAVTVLDAWRERGFGTPVTAEILTRAGVTESLSRRTLQSLVTLELVLPDGNPTQQFQDFRATRGDEEYRARLQEWLRGVYADVLQYADPSTDQHDRITEAFRGYEPEGQRRSMAALLIGLWRYAGLPVAAAPAATGGSNGRPAAPRRSAGAAPRPRKSKQNPEGQPAGGGTGGGTSLNVGGLPPGLVGLLHQIPSNGGSWTTERRDNFMQAFRAVLDFSVPVNDHPASEDADPAGEDEEL